ncbi:MAG: hypothetical protein ACJATI_000913 [Halioglobus sp.]|jgi:hypothetical protein
MRIIDPQNQWWGSDASIENVHIEVKPAGIFCETSITFDVKSTNSSFSDDIQLEFIYDFSMPGNVVFNDSWLWIEDYISKGEIYEQSEGTAIYEAIVDRQQDPSILTKYNEGSYNFRIYPLFDDSTRRVKLSYLAPFKDENTTLESSLPLSFLRDSYDKPQNVTLDITDDANWFHIPINTSEWSQTSVVNNVTTYTMSAESILANQKITFSSDTQNDYTLGVYEEDETKYFQLIYDPEIEYVTTPTYNLIVLDHETDNTNVELNTIISLLSHELNDLNDADKFNILYYDFTPQFTSDTWEQTNPENITDALNKVSNANTSTFSWLATLLPEALAYAEAKGQKTKIILLSADNNFAQEESSNDFLETINNFIGQMTTDVSISIADYSKNRPGDWIENQYYRGNEYLYNRLAQQHNGTYNISLTQDDMELVLYETFIRDIDYIDEYDLDIKSELGFSYSKYVIGSSEKIRLDKPIMLTGKYVGETPFNLEFSALYNGEIIQKDIMLTPNLELDGTATEAWAAQYILANENNSDQDIINDVIDVSMEMRILSKQTVFLCLERDTSAISSNNGDNGDDGGWTVATEDTKIDASKILAFPNPFTEYINIEIPSNIAPNNEGISVQILSIDGRLIHTIDQKNVIRDGKIFFKWTPSSRLDGGIYMIKIITESEVHTIKVMLVR